MRKISLFLIVCLCLTLLAGCGEKQKIYTAEDVGGKSYNYEKDGFGGSFTINLFEDGTFQYYEGMLSSYIGMGTWTLEENNVLCMKDQETVRFSDDSSKVEMYVRTNYFKVEEDCLVWLAENSDNFLYVDVEAGDRFLCDGLKINASSYFNGEKQNTKELISLEIVRTLIRLGHGYTGEERVRDLLEGFTCDDLVNVWGQPDSMTSGIWSFGWNLDETSAVWVVFDSDGYVSEVHLNVKE